VSLDLLHEVGALLVLAVLLAAGMAILSSFGRSSAGSWLGPALLSAILLAIAAACGAAGNRVGAAVLAAFAAVPLAVKAVVFFRHRRHALVPPDPP
jgi:hypothetical protein